MAPVSRKVPRRVAESLGDDVAEYLRHLEKTDPEFAAAFREERDRLALADRIRELREAHGLSQAQLARKIDTQQPSIARIESGRGLPRLEVLQRIASALGMRMVVEFVPLTASEPKQYHVSPHPAGWQGKAEGAQRASIVAPTKREAIARTVEIAKKQGLGQVIIYNEQGQIQSERTYGRDPCVSEETTYGKDPRVSDRESHRQSDRRGRGAPRR